MKMRRLSLLAICCIIVTGLGFNVRPAFAGPPFTGSFTQLSFPQDPKNPTNPCGLPTATGGTLTILSTSSDVGILYDGTGAQLNGFSFTDAAGQMFTKTTIPFGSQPTKNPIHMVEVIGGVTFLDISADDPCLPASAVPNGVVPPCVFPDRGDRRLNPVCDNPTQSAAIYCKIDWRGNLYLEIYAVWHSTGYIDFRATQPEINRVSSKPLKNTLIKRGKFVRLYRLTTGELQFNTYVEDVYIFPGANGTPETIAQMCGSSGKNYYGHFH